MRNAFSYINKALKMLFNIFLPVILPIFHYQCISFGQFTQYSNQASHIIIVITAFMVYYSAFKQGAKFDTEARNKYFSAENRNIFTALSIAFTRPYLWIVSAATALCYFAIPMRAVTSVLCGGQRDIVSLLIMLCICFALFVILGALATVTASVDWKKDGENQKHYTSSAYYEQAAIIAVVYTLGGTVLIYIFPYVSGITGIFKGLAEAVTVNGLITVLCIIAAIIVLPPLFRALRATAKRKAFIKQLKTACSRKGYELSEIKVPFKSLFQPYKGESFTIKTDKKTYSCKLLCSLKKSVPMVLHEDGRGEHIHTISIGKKGARIEIFRYVKAFDFDYESEHDKILIIVPVSKFMQTNKAGKIFDVDNGEEIGKYKMFAGTGFINALERECIDGARNKNLYKYI